MQIQYKIQMNEIAHCPELSHYNWIVWKINSSKNLGFTHFVEQYDDVSSFPMYHFGIIEEQPDGDIGFTTMKTGEGDGIDKDSVGWGGRSVTVDIF